MDETVKPYIKEWVCDRTAELVSEAEKLPEFQTEAEELKDIQDKMIAAFGKENADEFISAIRGADIPIEEHCYRSGMLDGLRLSGLIERVKSE